MRYETGCVSVSGDRKRTDQGPVVSAQAGVGREGPASQRLTPRGVAGGGMAAGAPSHGTPAEHLAPGGWALRRQVAEGAPFFAELGTRWRHSSGYRPLLV